MAVTFTDPSTTIPEVTFEEDTSLYIGTRVRVYFDSVGIISVGTITGFPTDNHVAVKFDRGTEEHVSLWRVERIPNEEHA